MIAARVTRQAVEVLHSSPATPKVRVTQQAVEVLHSSPATPKVRVTQQAVEVLHARYPMFSGQIIEGLGITDWVVIVSEYDTGIRTAVGVFSGDSYILPSGTLLPCLITLRPKFDYYWDPNKLSVFGELVVPSNPEITPHLFKVIKTGIFAGAEENWNLSGTTEQGTAILEYFAQLVDPVTIGPKVPVQA